MRGLPPLRRGAASDDSPQTKKLSPDQVPCTTKSTKKNSLYSGPQQPTDARAGAGFGACPEKNPRQAAFPALPRRRLGKEATGPHLGHRVFSIAIEAGGPAFSGAIIAAGLNDTRTQDLAPEIALVERLTQDDLIGSLELG